jgi:predicted regulator of Ras-like GTPase activity (Roadblock/LC7/MglB family)
LRIGSYQVNTFEENLNHLLNEADLTNQKRDGKAIQIVTQDGAVVEGDFTGQVDSLKIPISIALSFA